MVLNVEGKTDSKTRRFRAERVVLFSILMGYDPANSNGIVKSSMAERESLEDVLLLQQKCLVGGSREFD